MNENNLDSAERFVLDFIRADYDVWKANYTVRETETLNKVFDEFAKKFYDFQVTIPVGRPTSPTETWFENDAREDLEVTFERPLFKIDQYMVDGTSVYAAYTGSTDEGSSAYYEIVVFKEEQGIYKIFSVYHPDFEGGVKHFQGARFSFPEDRRVAIRRLRAPDDDLDLQDYELDPESQG